MEGIACTAPKPAKEKSDVPKTTMAKKTNFSEGKSAQ